MAGGGGRGKTVHKRKAGSKRKEETEGEVCRGGEKRNEIVSSIESII
jgi:hypothetical protein